MNFNLLAKLREISSKKSNRPKREIFAPGRVNIIGEHLDYNGGSVLPFSIDKGVYSIISKSEDFELFALDLREKFEFKNCEEFDLNKSSWLNYVLGVYLLLKKDHPKIQGFHLSFGSDLPSGAGLSSSAALCNSMVYGLNMIYELNLSKLEMAKVSQSAEQLYAGVNCGIMDPYASLFGKKDNAIHLNCQSLESEYIPMILPGHKWILFNTGKTHQLNDSPYNNRKEICQRALRKINQNGYQIENLCQSDLKNIGSFREFLNENEFRKSSYVIQENARVQLAISALKSQDLETLGTLLFESHDGLRKSYEVSSAELDFLVDLGKIQNGVKGARLVGAGFGGCVLTLVDTDLEKQITEKFKEEFYSKFNRQLNIYYPSSGKGVHEIVN
jgi:galactokinase